MVAPKVQQMSKMPKVPKMPKIKVFCLIIFHSIFMFVWMDTLDDLVEKLFKLIG